MSDAHTPIESQNAGSIVGSAESVVRVPQRWLRFLRRCLALRPGRYIIVVTVSSDFCDWTVTEAGRVER